MRTATGQSEPGIDLSKIRELEERLDNFRIQVDGGMTIRGNAWQGYAVNSPTCGELGFGGGPTPEPGACCLPDGTCEVVTVGQCLLDGGTFQGGGTNCDTTGACCMGSDCIITTEDCCSNAGGTYQGDGEVCEPNPCGGNPPCPCLYSALIEPFSDGMGGYWTTLTSDCCASTLTYSGSTTKYTRFLTLSSTNTICDEFGLTGGPVNCEFFIDTDTCEAALQTGPCSGEILDEHGNCYENCQDVSHPDCACNFNSCQPHTINVTTLSDPCDPPTGACCVLGACIEEQQEHCDDDFGFYYGNGTTCPQGTCF